MGLLPGCRSTFETIEDSVPTSGLSKDQIITVVYDPSAQNRLDKDQLRITTLKAKEGDFDSMRELYGHYSFGDFDEKKAEFWLERLAEAGHPTHQYNLGTRLIEEGNLSEGLEWIKKAVKNGCPYAEKYMEAEEWKRS